jgi:hypothetical protein
MYKHTKYYSNNIILQKKCSFLAQKCKKNNIIFVFSLKNCNFAVRKNYTELRFGQI